MKTPLFKSIAALAVATVFALSSIQTTAQEPAYFVLTKYSLANDEQEGLLDRFLENAFVPAMARLGHGPVGVFDVMEDSEENAVYVATSFPTFESYESLKGQLAQDSAFMSAAEEYLFRDNKASAAFERQERRLLRAFSGMPQWKAPESGDRLFELRDYESYSEVTGELKVEMFNVAEIEIFEDVGLNAVFYGQTLIGPNQPNLVYLLVHDDMDAHAAAWDRFLKAPAWKELSQNERYKGTVSKIHRTFLRPKAYSQL